MELIILLLKRGNVGGIFMITDYSCFCYFDIHCDFF